MSDDLEPDDLDWDLADGVSPTDLSDAGFRPDESVEDDE